MPQLSLTTPQNPNIPVVPGNVQGGPPNTQQKEFNVFTLCRIGQETVIDILSRIQDIFGLLRNLTPPNGLMSSQLSMEKKQKIQDQFRTVRLLFKRLRLLHEKCDPNDEFSETSIESLIPYVDEIDNSTDQNVPVHSEEYQKALMENKMLKEQVALKNEHLKDIIDRMRTIIWEINSMMAARKS
jgi:mediator of RNA polymerase II transcription subunit 30